MKRITKLLLALLTGLLMTLGWPEHGFPLLLFAGLVPLLLIENVQWENRKENSWFGIFGYTYLAFFIWNALTTYWICNSTLVGAIAAVLLNTLFMSIVFTLFHVTRRNMISGKGGYLALIGYWLSFEYLHLRWDLNWPWLNLGHGFGAYNKWIQWYEYTGVFGGTLWILLVNILLFLVIRDLVQKKSITRNFYMKTAGFVLMIFVPMAVSYLMYRNYQEKPAPVDVVVIQPNVDPYNEQYDLGPAVILQRMLDLAKTKADSNTQFVVCPESALQEYVWEDRFEQSQSLKSLRQFNRMYKQLSFVTGMSTRKIYEEGEPVSLTARKFKDAERYYDSYNTALFVNHDSTFQKYHKSKLTPGVEKMPYPRLFKFLENYAIDLGGTVGSLGVDAERTPFKVNDTLKIAPCICYESVYGEFMNGFVRNGANLIFVITNDGWWKNTPGHRQHLLFSSIRAIETRRCVARSANTGISCFINQRGDILQRTTYWTPIAIRQEINANSRLTFYVKFGDYIGRIGLLVAALMVLLTISFGIKNRSGSIKSH
jgi:apolipoprotein N-acyltransferase